MDTLVKETNAVPVDLLGRQEIVDRIMKILEVISEKKSSCTFALNGAWGTGKTFVLNMLMNQLWECHSDQFIVFHYNCWQYDYYEEPLIAIVAAMLDSVDNENHLLPTNLRDEVKAGIKLARPVLQKIATEFVKNKIGVDLTDVISTVNDYNHALDAEEEDRANARSFDEFYSFKKVIQLAHNELNKLTNERTLVIVVDELDRCLPAYAIKVLERLHHLFESLKNTVVLLAVDKNQLDTTVKQLFGDKTDTSHYLRKFINFEITLETKAVDQKNLRMKYADFFNSFDFPQEIHPFPVETFIASLLSDIPIRVQEQIINRVHTVNQLLSHDRPFDISYLCCELLWIILTEVYGFTNEFPLNYTNGFNVQGEPGFKIKTNINNYFTQFFEKYWSAHFIIVKDQHPLIGNKSILAGDGTMQKLLVYYISGLFSFFYDKEQPFLIDTSDDDPFFSIDYERNLSYLYDAMTLFSAIK